MRASTNVVKTETLTRVVKRSAAIMAWSSAALQTYRHTRTVIAKKERAGCDQANHFICPENHLKCGVEEPALTTEECT